MTYQNFDQAGEGETRLLLGRGQKRDQAKKQSLRIFLRKILSSVEHKKNQSRFFIRANTLVAPKMVTFAPNRNARYTSSILIPTLPSASVRMVFRAYAEVITKFSRIHRFPIFFNNKAPLRAQLARTLR